MLQRHRRFLYLFIGCVLFAGVLSILNTPATQTTSDYTPLQKPFPSEPPEGWTGEWPPTGPPGDLDPDRTGDGRPNPNPADSSVSFDVAFPIELIAGGSLLFVIGAVIVYFAKNYEENSEESRTDILQQIYSFDDEIEEEMRDVRKKEDIRQSPEERIFEEAAARASYEEWDQLLESIEAFFVDGMIESAKMTEVVKKMLPLRDSGLISLSRKNISDEIRIIITYNLL